MRSYDFTVKDGNTIYHDCVAQVVLPILHVPEFGIINWVKAVRIPFGGTPGATQIDYRILTKYPLDNFSGPDTFYDIIPTASLGAAATVQFDEYEREYALHDERGQASGGTLSYAAGQPTAGDTIEIDGHTYTFVATAAEVLSYKDVLIGATGDITYTTLSNQVNSLKGPTRVTALFNTLTVQIGGAHTPAQSQKYAYDRTLRLATDAEWTAKALPTNLGPWVPDNPTRYQDEKVLWLMVDAAGLTNQVGFMLNITDEYGRR